jgi:hypothetical protein
VNSGHAGLPTTTVTMIDAEVERPALRRVDLVKLDVEGFELAALHGATRTLAGNPDLIVQTEIVPAHPARCGFSATDMIRFLSGFGFHPHACDDEGRLHPVSETAPGDEAYWFWARRDRHPQLDEPGRAP